MSRYPGENLGNNVPNYLFDVTHLHSLRVNWNVFTQMHSCIFARVSKKSSLRSHNLTSAIACAYSASIAGVVDFTFAFRIHFFSRRLFTIMNVNFPRSFLPMHPQLGFSRSLPSQKRQNAEFNGTTSAQYITMRFFLLNIGTMRMQLRMTLHKLYSNVSIMLMVHV